LPEHTHTVVTVVTVVVVVFHNGYCSPPPLVPRVGNDVVRKKCFAAVTFCLYVTYIITM
jgi:hypothetical protein